MSPSTLHSKDLPAHPVLTTRKDSRANSPRYLGVGFQKCGSTSLFHLLVGNVPRFKPPRQASKGEKELHAIPRDRQATKRDLKEYLKKLGPVVPGIREPLDFTPNYAFQPTTLSNILLMFPDVKLFMIVRDPVDRFYSALDHGKQIGMVNPGLSDVEAFHQSKKSRKAWVSGLLPHGLFVPSIRMAYRLFGRPSVYLTSLDLLRSKGSGPSELQRLAKFIEEPETIFDSGLVPHLNKSGNKDREFSGLDRSERTEEGEHLIRNFYAKWATQLDELLAERDS